jgi:hypothetical protein
MKRETVGKCRLLDWDANAAVRLPDDMFPSIMKSDVRPPVRCFREF